MFQKSRLLICSLFIMISCSTTDYFNDPVDLESIALENNWEFVKASTFTKEFKDGAHLILYSSDESSNFRKGIIMYSDESLNFPKITSNLEIALFDDGIIFLNRTGEIFSFLVEGKSSTNLSEIFNRRIYQNFGYGLSRIHGNWKINDDSEKDMVHAFLHNNNLDKNIQYYSSRVEEECTSGGPGATDCSIDEPFGGCSVSCAEGYYACCKSSTTQCICVPNGGEEQ